MRLSPASLLTLAVLVAGCTGDAATSTPATFSSTMPTSDDTGIVRGRVTDDEGLPVAAATVALVDAPGVPQTSSREDGAFELGGIVPGTYRLLVERLGYEQSVRRVEVIAGETAEVNVLLLPLKIIEAYFETGSVNGIVGCSVSAGYEYSCGEPVLGVNWYPNQKHIVNLSVPASNLAMLMELDWRAASDAAKQLRVIMSEESIECHIAVCFVGSQAVWSARGERVLQVPIDEDGMKRFEKRPTSLEARVSASGQGVVVEQRFTIYWTAFYGSGIPEGYTAAPPEPV